MALNEVIRTSGDVRRLLAQTMVEIKNGNLSTDKGLAIAALSKELTASMQVEINVVKVHLAAGESGKKMGQLTQLGRMVIEDVDPQTISGA